MEAFLAVGTQWRFVVLGGGMGPTVVREAGLDYTAADAAWRRLGMDVDAETFARVQIMEHAVIEAGNRG
ncbi:MAG: DUF1799 domain-containing protein [Deltaproteobacteria bacterium]|nr:DUF1799 domain-containing protein [Deltaproteobacteria bacterium]